MPRVNSGDEDLNQIVFFPMNDGIARFIPGELESVIMDIVWDLIEKGTEVGVDIVHKTLIERGKILRYPTVAKTMNRLVDKGIMRRVDGLIGVGRHCFVYVPIFTRDEFIRRIIHSILDSILENNRPVFIGWILLNIAEFDKVRY